MHEALRFSPIASLKRRADCGEIEWLAFLEMVRLGSEVLEPGFADRIMQAEGLAFIVVGDELAAIGGLKAPDKDDRLRIFMEAGADQSPEDYSVEVAWVFVKERFRGNGLATLVMQTLSPLYEKQNCYATAHTATAYMHATLLRDGFIQAGNAISSRDGEGQLLFIRDGKRTTD